MAPRRRLPQRLAVVVASVATLSGCASQPGDYNCLVKHVPDGGELIVARDGSPVDPTTCHAPECNGSFDGGYGRLVYRAPNGDEAPNCAA